MKNYCEIFVTLCGIMAFESGDCLAQNTLIENEQCRILISDKITFSEAVETALCRNPDLHQSYLDMKRTSFEMKEANADYLPSVSLTGNLFSSTRKADKRRSDSEGSAGIALSYLLYDFGGRKAHSDQAELMFSASKMMYESYVQSLIYQVAEAFYRLLSAQKNKESAVVSEKSYAEALNLAERRYEVGLVKKLDFLQAETALAKAKIKTDTTQKEINLRRTALLELLHLPMTTPLVASDDLIETEDNLPSPDDLIQQAFKERPDLKALVFKTKASYEKLREVKASSKGKLMFNMSGNSGYSFKSDDDYYDGKAGVYVSFPIFTGFADTYRIKASEEKYRQQQSEEQSTFAKVAREVADSYALYQNALTEHDLLKKLLQSAEESEKVAHRSYEVGQSDMVSWLQTLSDLSQARSDYALAENQAVIRKIQLLKAVGGIDGKTYQERK